jgi:hypothetical protein
VFTRLLGSARYALRRQGLARGALNPTLKILASARRVALCVCSEFSAADPRCDAAADELIAIAKGDNGEARIRSAGAGPGR